MPSARWPSPRPSRPLNGVTGAGTTFTGTWSCTTADETKSGTWTRTGAGPATLTGGADQILLTSTCSVTENDPATPPSPGDPSYAWGAKTLGAPVTLTAAAAERHPHGRQPGGPRHRHVLGHQERGGRRAGHRVRRRRLHLHLHLPRGITGTVTVRAGQTTQVGTSIPNGATCTIEETGRPRPHHSLRLGRRDASRRRPSPSPDATPGRGPRHQHDQPTHGHRDACARSWTTLTAGSPATPTSRSAWCAA